MMLEIMIKVLLEFLITTLLPPNKMLKDARCLSSQEWLRPLGCAISIPAVITTAVGQMAISKGRQGREAQNVPRVGWPMLPVLHLFKQLQLLLLHRPYLFHKIKLAYPRQIHQQMLQIRKLASAFF